MHVQDCALGCQFGLWACVYAYLQVERSSTSHSASQLQQLKQRYTQMQQEAAWSSGQSNTTSPESSQTSNLFLVSPCSLSHQQPRQDNYLRQTLALKWVRFTIPVPSFWYGLLGIVTVPGAYVRAVQPAHARTCKGLNGGQQPGLQAFLPHGMGSPSIRSCDQE